jgi:hypothetical protein
MADERNRKSDLPTTRQLWSWLPLLVLGLSTLAACDRGKQLRPAPPTYPVVGEVRADGGKIPSGAQIEFRPESAEKANDFTARSVIDGAGKFTLNTPFIDRVLPGAIEGPFRVRILFPSGNNPTTISGSGLISVPEKFTVQPTDNHFIINLPKQQ